MSKKISITNFLKMSPEIPQYTNSNQHYLIAGANPTYYMDTTGTQEEQVAPLIASNIWTKPLTNLYPSPVWDVTESTDKKYEGYILDNQGGVLGFDSTGIVFLSVPLSTASSGGALKCFNNALLVKPDHFSGNVYKRTMPADIGAWTTLFSMIGMTAGGYFMENFLEYCLITETDSKVKKIDASFSLLNGIDLGGGWVISGIRNYNDKYVAIAASNGNFNNNYLFLWNGRGDTYQYSVKMTGKFMDMKVIDGTLYVAIWISGTGNTLGTGRTSIYYLSGTKLVEYLTPQISTIQSGFKTSLFNFINRLGINLYSTDLMISGKSSVGKEQFIVNTGINFTKFSETYNGKIVGFTSSLINGQNSMYFYDPISPTYNTILYKSNWIPVKNLSGIDIYYDTPPASGTDAINVTIYGRGEDIVSGNSTIVLDSITPTNFLNTTRTRLDVKGFTGDLVKIELSTINTGSWRASIRKIELIVE